MKKKLNNENPKPEPIHLQVKPALVVFNDKFFRNKLFISLVLVVGGILFMEVVTRAFFVDPNLIDNWGYNSGGYGDLLPRKNFVASEVPDLPYRVVTNAAGLRDAQETNYSKTTGVARVLAVGDSFTFGPYVNNQDTYPAKLERILLENNVKAEVLNAGVSGYTLADQIGYLEEKGFALSPDIVLIGIYQNDISDYDPLKRGFFSRQLQKERLQKWPVVFSLAKKSALLTLVQKKAVSDQTKKARAVSVNTDTQIKDEWKKAYFADLDKLTNELKDRKIKALFVIFPSARQLELEGYQPQDEIIERLSEKDQHFIDLKPVFENEAIKDDLYLKPFNEHLSESGNYIAASAISKEVVELLGESLEK